MMSWSLHEKKLKRWKENVVFLFSRHKIWLGNFIGSMIVLEQKFSLSHICITCRPLILILVISHFLWKNAFGFDNSSLHRGLNLVACQLRTYIWYYGLLLWVLCINVVLLVVARAPLLIPPPLFLPWEECIRHDAVWSQTNFFKSRKGTTMTHLYRLLYMHHW